MDYPLLDKSSFVPIYYQLYKHFETLILSGTLAPGDMLPTEMEFAEEYDISRMTVRRAISELAATGMIYSVKGKGTFVAEPKLDDMTFNLNQRFNDGEADEEMTPQLLECRIIKADAHISNRLGIEIGTHCLFCRMVTKAGGIPLIYEIRYAVYSKRAPLIENQLQDLSLTKVASAHSDQVPSRTKRILMASGAMNDEPKILQIKDGDPVFLMIQTIYDQDNHVIAWGKSIYRGDRYRLVSYNGWNLEEVKKTGGKHLYV